MTDYRYRKKPVVIEAYQMIKDNPEPWPIWLIDAWSKPDYEIGSVWLYTPIFEDESNSYFKIETLEGTMTVPKDGWIIRGVAGELYACDPYIFSRTYEKA